MDRSAAKEGELCSTKMEPSRIEETHAKQLKIQTNAMYNYQKKLFLLKKGSGMTFLPVNISEDILLKPKCGKNMLDVCCDPTLHYVYRAMVDTR